MDWWDAAGAFFRRIPFERVLFPPRDNTKAVQEFLKTFKATEGQSPPPPAKKETATTQQPQGVAQSASTAVLTREGVDAKRMAWQDGIIRGELWLLEGHLKNNCLGCGGDVECCWKHTQNILDGVRETQSMTTEPLYREAIAIAERVLPFVYPEDVKTGKYREKYPSLTIEVSHVRTKFDKRVMGYAREPITLEEAKRLAAEEAAKEVERKWHSPEKK